MMCVRAFIGRFKSFGIEIGLCPNRNIHRRVCRDDACWLVWFGCCGSRHLSRTHVRCTHIAHSNCVHDVCVVEFSNESRAVTIIRSADVNTMQDTEMWRISSIAMPHAQHSMLASFILILSFFFALPSFMSSASLRYSRNGILIAGHDAGGSSEWRVICMQCTTTKQPQNRNDALNL